jgi:hypothetical protein
MGSTTIIADPGVEENAVSDPMVIVLVVVAAVVACLVFLSLAYCRQQTFKAQVAASTNEESPHGTQTQVNHWLPQALQNDPAAHSFPPLLGHPQKHLMKSSSKVSL